MVKRVTDEQMEQLREFCRATVPYYKSFLMMQYFNVMQAHQSETDDDDITREDYDIDEDDDYYQYECNSCDKHTLYSKKPPSDYPMRLCMNDDCLTEFLIKTLIS